MIPCLETHLADMNAWLPIRGPFLILFLQEWGLFLGGEIPLRKNLFYKDSLKITEATTKHEAVLISSFLLALCKQPKE